MTSIGNQAFYKCIVLTSVTIPNSETNVGDEVFDGCYNITSATLGMKNIPKGFFSGLSSNSRLSSVTMLDGVTSIGAFAFTNCSKLTSVTIPNSVTSIGEGVFYECSGLTSITIPNTVTSIGKWAFYGCSGLTSITIPNSVTSIGYQTFYDCSSLTSITIPNSVTSIGECAFWGCSGLTSVTIPNSVTSIGNGGFSGCSELTTVTIPNSVTSIGKNAFSGCSGLTSITISKSVTSIGYGVFRDCSSLTSIIVEEGNPKYDSRNHCNAIIETSSNTLITGCKNTIIPNSVTSIGYCAFSNCTSLTSITIPNTVTSIGDEAFDSCKSLTSVTIPNSVTSIGDYAFALCTSLTSITIPSSVTSIGSSAFSACSGLASITCEANIPPNCQNDCFGRVYIFIPVYVPANSIAQYNAAYGWNKFTNIQAIIEPASISFTNSSEDLIVGMTKKLETTITPEDATTKTITWTSSNTDVATVSSEGVITAKGAGTTIITATTNNGKTAKCTITVEQPVTAIALSETTASLWVGKTKTLTATISPTTANNTTVNWSSSNNNVATVSSQGVITAKSKGSCTITCTAADGYGTKSTCEIIVKQQVTSIDFGYETLTMTCGDEKTLTPTINPSNADVKTLTWKSTDNSVAIITSEGVLTAVSPGTATITCTATDDFKKSSSITVIVEPLEITITDKNPTIKEGTYWKGGISYTRTLTKNKHTTFCMPYDVNLSDYTEYFSQVYVPMEMAFVKSGGKLMVMFKSVSLTETIRAGQPFIALASKSGTVAIKNSSKVTITSLEEPIPTNLEVYNYGGNLLSRNTDVDVKITGNYSIVADLDDANNFTFSVNGQMVGATTVSPYRFYITKNDERSSAKITDILLSFDGEESTGIEDIINEQKGDDKFYNLNGQRINKSNAQKGIYIINGKKYAK